MSSINLGSFVQNNGRTTGLGFISGLDSNSLIDSILAGKQESITAVEDNITSNTEKIDKIGELRTLLDRFKTASDFLRNPPGVGNESNDFFKHTTSSLTSSTTTAASTYLSVTTQAGATLNKYSITDVSIANEHLLRKDGFTSDTESVVGNLSVTDNYQTSLGTVSGNVLNAATPITFANNTKGTRASVDLVFGTQNQFDAGDQLVFGTTTITFGGGGGDDVDISGASTVSEKLQVVADRMNAKTTGEEEKYIYSVSGNTLTVTRRVEGSNTQVGTALPINANFSADMADETQTVAIGSQGAGVNPAGGNLDALGTDGNNGTTATAAVLDVVFGSENSFDAADQIAFGSTVITFGGTGGNDIDISSATTLDQKIDAIVTRMNLIASGDESNYTYSRDTSGVLTITRDTAGPIATVGNDITVSADFSKGTTDTTQTVAIGRNYKNNGSAAGSVAKSNGPISGSVSQNGVDGVAAASQASINIVFGNNIFDATDQLVFGGTETITFGGGGGDDVTVGGDLATTLVNIANQLNSKTAGDVSGYTFTTNGVDTLIVTRDVVGSNATVGTNLTIASDLSIDMTDTTNTVAIGDVGATNGPSAGLVNINGTEGVSRTSVSDAKTTHITTLSGAVTVNSVNYIAGSGTATSFVPNTLEFKATVNGQTYTSKPVVLDGGAINAAAIGAGDNNLGNRIASGTVITFVKDLDDDETEGTEEVTFQLVVGDEATVDNSGEADTYATSINTFLNTTNSITITQSPTVPPLRAGTFNIGGVDITLDEGDNLQVIKSKINAVSSTAGVVADIIKVSDNSFSLILKASNTGLDNKIFEYGDSEAGDGVSGTIQLGNDNVTFTEQQAAKDATFKIDGLTVTRATNQVSDAIDKLTFNLISDTPVGSPPTLTLDVSQDKEIVKTGITDFLNAFNDLKFFISEQTQRDENLELLETSILGDEPIIADVLRDIESQLSRIVSGISTSQLQSLFEVGIDIIDFPGSEDVPETPDVFVLDEDKIDANLESKFEELRNVFIFNFSANSPELSVFSRTNNVSLTNFKLDIDTSRSPNSDKVRVLDSDDNFLFNADINGSSITGAAGTSLEGLNLVYTGDGTDVITVNLTQGIADRIYNVLDTYLVEDGLVDNAILGLLDDNERLQERVDRDNESLEAEKELLILEFTRLEAIISDANNVLSFLNAQRDSDNSNN